MVRTISSSPQQTFCSTSLFSNSGSFPSSNLHIRRRHPNGFSGTPSAKFPTRAVSLGKTEPKIRSKNPTRSGFDMVNLTTWLLKQEQSGQIDAELTIVLSSISLACKQIASLLQRSSIINLTGGHGTINIQGEDQKKLDVISNEVIN